jgi:hypothetical protein
MIRIWASNFRPGFAQRDRLRLRKPLAGKYLGDPAGIYFKMGSEDVLRFAREESPLPDLYSIIQA